MSLLVLGVCCLACLKASHRGMWGCAWVYWGYTEILVYTCVLKGMCLIGGYSVLGFVCMLSFIMFACDLCILEEGGCSLHGMLLVRAFYPAYHLSPSLPGIMHFSCMFRI